MDPEAKDPSSAGGDPDEFTIARKRSRRVSFAETTAIHVFDRDEDFETPPDSKPCSEGSKPGNEELGFQSEHFDSDDSKGSAREDEEDEDEDDEGEQERFIRDMDSSSPGSATGSVMSNDDENFFGPVSTSFIKSGRLSDAGVSDDNNHDITLDSTAFSLHFQNIVPPDDRSANSAGSLRTPLTGDSVPVDSHGFIMVSKGFKKHAPQSKLSDGKMSGSAGDSSNMSFVVENPDSYDRYGKMSPTLEALLDEANKSMQPNSPIIGSETRAFQHDNNSPAVKESINNEIHTHRENTPGKAGDACFDSNLSEGCSMDVDGDWNGTGIPSPNKKTSLSIDGFMNEKTQVTFSPKSNSYSNDVCQPILSNALALNVQNTDMLSPPYTTSHNNLTLQSGQVQQELFHDQVSGSKHSLDSSLKSMPILPALANVDVQQQLISEQGMQTPQNAAQPLQSPLPGSVSSLRCKRKQLFLDPFVMSKNRLMHTPDKEEPLSFLKSKLIQHGERISAIKIPKSVINKSPIIIDRPALLDNDHMPYELEGALEKSNDGHTAKHMGMSSSSEKNSQTNISPEGMSASNGKDSQIKVSQEASGQDNCIHLNHSGSSASNGSVLTNLGENEVGGETVKLITGISSVQLSHSEVNRKENLLIFDNPIEQASLDVHGSFSGQTTPKESSQILNTLHGTISSPIGIGVKISASQDLQSVQESRSVQTELPGRKRGIERILLADEDHLNEASRLQKSPKVLPAVVSSDIGIFSGHNAECNNEQVSVRGQATQKHWTDVLSKACDAPKQIFLPSICKLNSGELDILEDILTQMQAAKKYERLYTSLRTQSCWGELNQKRVAEAQSLLDRLVYDKAKLQLKQKKLDELSNKAQQLKSKIQECAKLKSIYSQFCPLGARVVHHLASPLISNSNDFFTRDQAEYNRVTSMRQELEMLDQKVKRMMKAFETSCNIKGNTSCDRIIKVVNDHIEMKIRCRVIQQDLQLWKLSDVVTENDRCDIILNYCNVLSQRFTIHRRSVSSILSCNILNHASIEKKFPNMNACIAFEFIFKAKGDRRIASSKQISLETLETNLLLGTLLDVLEEVLVSRIQSWNLISSTFHLQCSGQLDLQLSFLRFKSGQKMTLSLDLTFLNCAAYPSKPSDLQIRFIEGKATIPLLISDEIMSSVKNLESGRWIIVRLCKCISKIVQESDGW